MLMGKESIIVKAVNYKSVIDGQVDPHMALVVLKLHGKSRGENWVVGTISIDCLMALYPLYSAVLQKIHCVHVQASGIRVRRRREIRFDRTNCWALRHTGPWSISVWVDH